MKVSTIIFLLLATLLFCQCKIFQYEDTPRNSNGDNYRYMLPERSRNLDMEESNHVPGKCYAKCIIPDKMEWQSEEYIVYTGDELEEEVDISYRQIVIQKKSQKWIKKNSAGQMVWCMVETPAVTEEIKILKDTTQSKNFEIRTLDYKVVTERGGFTEWRAVLCGNKVTKEVVVQLQDSLRANGYYDGENTEILDAETKAVLTKFQKDNNLPVGQLDLETLDVLGVLYVE